MHHLLASIETHTDLARACRRRPCCRRPPRRRSWRRSSRRSGRGSGGGGEEFLPYSAELVAPPRVRFEESLDVRDGCGELLCLERLHLADDGLVLAGDLVLRERQFRLVLGELVEAFLLARLLGALFRHLQLRLIPRLVVEGGLDAVGVLRRGGGGRRRDDARRILHDELAVGHEVRLLQRQRQRLACPSKIAPHRRGPRDDEGEGHG
mmetsp:Transcript_45927/g.109578  ORF Transcript_45927/g.109578 Transcript_45927/m.109578 type:complete len:208 (-) Transcript_45927:352-975(-)